jgi:hypothetical protein
MDGLLPNEALALLAAGVGRDGLARRLKNRVAEDAAIDFLRPNDKHSSAVGASSFDVDGERREPSVGGGHYTRAHNGRTNTRARARKSAPGIMPTQFYDVAAKSKILVPDEAITRTTYKARGRTTYAFRGHLADGRTLTRFVSRLAWESAGYPIGK